MKKEQPPFQVVAFSSAIVSQLAGRSLAGLFQGNGWMATSPPNPLT